MTKNKWKVIMPKKGSIETILNHVRKHIDDCMNVVITKEQLHLLESVEARVAALKLSEEISFRFSVFRPKEYATVFTTVFPHTIQLKRPLPGGTLGEHRILYRPPTALVNAKNAICKQVLVAHLGEIAYEKERGEHQSSICFLYNYAHRMKLPSPGIISCSMQTANHHKATGIVSSAELVPTDGEVQIRGKATDTYGAALESTFSLLDNIITKLNIEELCKLGTSKPLPSQRLEPITRHSHPRLKATKDQRL